MISSTKKADAISRNRTWYFGALALVLATHQGLFWQWDNRNYDWESTLSWALLASTILYAIATGGQPFMSKTLRELTDDEVTRANRMKALSMSFVTTMAAAIFIFAASPNLTMTLQRAIHAVVSIGLITALIVFIIEERKALG